MAAALVPSAVAREANVDILEQMERLKLYDEEATSIRVTETARDKYDKAIKAAQQFDKRLKSEANIMNDMEKFKKDK